MQGIVLGLSSLFHGLPCGLDDKESSCNAEDPGLMPGLGRSPGEGKVYPPQYSGLENPRDKGVWRAYKELDMTEQLSFQYLQFHIDL